MLVRFVNPPPNRPRPGEARQGQQGQDGDDDEGHFPFTCVNAKSSNVTPLRRLFDAATTAGQYFDGMLLRNRICLALSGLIPTSAAKIAAFFQAPMMSRCVFMRSI